MALRKGGPDLDASGAGADRCAVDRPAGDVEITSFGPERVDELESLWLSLHAHHLALAPHLAALGAELPASAF